MSTHPVMGQDNWPMSSKLFTTVLGIVTLTPFVYVATTHAVSVTHNLQTQQNTIQELSTESVQLDKKLEVTQETKEQTKQEVVQTEQEVNDILSERKRLEAELGAN